MQFLSLHRNDKAFPIVLSHLMDILSRLRKVLAPASSPILKETSSLASKLLYDLSTSLDAINYAATCGLLDSAVKLVAGMAPNLTSSIFNHCAASEFFCSTLTEDEFCALSMLSVLKRASGRFRSLSPAQMRVENHNHCLSSFLWSFFNGHESGSYGVLFDKNEVISVNFLSVMRKSCFALNMYVY